MKTMKTFNPKMSLSNRYSLNSKLTGSTSVIYGSNINGIVYAPYIMAKEISFSMKMEYKKFIENNN